MRKIIPALLALFTCMGAAAQNYGAHMIPDDLVRGANAVVRCDETVFDYRSKSSATSRHTMVVTVLNPAGDAAAVFSEYATGNRVFKGFSGEIFDDTGRSIRKVKRSEVKESEFSEGLADDSRSYLFEPHVPGYPYTVQYSYEVQYSGGIIAFPVFAPVPTLGVAVEKATYKLTIPTGTKFHWHSPNVEITPTHKDNGKTTEWAWTMENLRPMTTEPYGPLIRNRIPIVYLSPHEFTYGGSDGVMDTWESYARWQWTLLDGRGALPDPLKAKIAELTADATTDFERISALYDYLAATTRYVSIQIGIGGLQPMKAEDVYRNKFGDCKALSNYMQAMLAECGIESHYVEIGVNNRNIIPEYANPLLSNHAILQIPMDDGVMWLECTAPEFPLGFSHPGIAGQNALVYKNRTAEIVEVGVYPDSLHMSEITGELTLSADGSMKGHVTMTDHCNRYMEHFEMAKMDGRERANHLQRGINIPLARISNIAFAEHKTREPWCVTEYDIETRQIGEASAGRIFLDVSPLRKFPGKKLGKAARKTDIVVEDGFLNRENITIELPEGMVCEALPPPVELDTKYGQFHQIVLPLGDKLVINRSFLFRRATYPAGEFAGFKAFMEAIDKAYGARIVLKKE
ncbi:transglutaminase family protein [Alistipes sp. OttesenSCG-928-B03]|nr:transglutaminase family protein [Alistipes sp. OttesenSCG-928-B03]